MTKTRPRLETTQLWRHGYIAIVPHKVNDTDYEERKRLMSKWNL
jgi:hypothetical protein